MDAVTQKEATLMSLHASLSRREEGGESRHRQCQEQAEGTRRPMRRMQCSTMCESATQMSSSQPPALRLFVVILEIVH
jgi:hypothetical protein